MQIGGLFLAQCPEISERMADDKIADAQASGADIITSSDLGCLLHLAGRIARRGLTLRVRHVADSGSRNRRAGDGREMTYDPRRFVEASHEALQDPRLQPALARLKTHFALGRSLAQRASAISRRCANAAAPSAIPRSPISIRCSKHSNAM